MMTRDTPETSWHPLLLNVYSQPQVHEGGPSSNVDYFLLPLWQHKLPLEITAVEQPQAPSDLKQAQKAPQWARLMLQYAQTKYGRIWRTEAICSGNTRRACLAPKLSLALTLEPAVWM
ncbi:unnamed protein product [Lota lota]